MSDEDDIELRVRVQKELVKEALKDGLKEWMNEKFQDVGKWTVYAALALMFGGLVYFVLMLSGWHAPNR